MKKRDIQMMNDALKSRKAIPHTPEENKKLITESTKGLKNYQKIIDEAPQEIKDKVVRWMDEQDDKHEPLTYYCDTIRHLVCLPYSIENLHRMARNLGLKERWFHKNHYDIPINRIEDITAKCKVVRPRQILEIIKTNSISL